MKELLEVKAPRGRLIVKRLEVKYKESSLIIPDGTAAKNSSVVYDYHPLQCEVVIKGEDSDNIKVDYEIGDIVILGSVPTPEKSLRWNKENYYVIRADYDIIGWIPKKAKSKVQHIYKT